MICMTKIATMAASRGQSRISGVLSWQQLTLRYLFLQLLAFAAATNIFKFQWIMTMNNCLPGETWGLAVVPLGLEGSAGPGWIWLGLAWSHVSSHAGSYPKGAATIWGMLFHNRGQNLQGSKAKSHKYIKIFFSEMAYGPLAKARHTAKCKVDAVGRSKLTVGKLSKAWGNKWLWTKNTAILRKSVQGYRLLHCLH